ncbi:MAG: metalloregulator ArsR/SmtB family transcription factor [Mycobacterium sp.]
MPKQSAVLPPRGDRLDGVFHALSDPTRRAVIERLCRGPASTSELAQPFAMALPSFTQHLTVLEHSGLVSSAKEGRVRTYRLTGDELVSAESWLSHQRSMWVRRLDQLDEFLTADTSEPLPNKED